MKRRVDLHIHSYASDGEWSPQQLFDNVDSKNIKIFAVCDHDETECISEMVKITKDREDINYIKGVEITSSIDGMEYHILTYFVDEKNEELQELLDYNRQQRITYNQNLIHFLNKKFQEITIEDHEDYVYNPYRGGWRMYHYLSDKGIVSSLREYFEVVKDFPDKMVFHNPEILIPKLNALGYTPILAHPSAYTKGDILDESALDFFRDIGIQGIECYTNYLNDQSNSSYYVEYCQKNNLKITGGSDCHGSFVARKLGHPKVYENMISII